MISVSTKRLVAGLLTVFIFSFATCKYGFKDMGALPAEVKTFRVNAFENKAQYVNPQLSPQLSEKLKQKIINTTRLRQTNSDDAHYDINGYVSQYYTSTTGISGSNASQNRLNVTFHVIFKNALNDKKNFEADLNYNKDYPATQSLSQAEADLNTTMINNITDQIFNRIFSDW
jgi:outer membrane lipopolysaccharide assembly protein LptE/RlpB